MEVKIYNIVEQKELIIGDLTGFNPSGINNGLDHFEITFKNFNFFDHCKNCKNCGSFYNSLNSETLNWFLDFNNNKYRLDLTKYSVKTSNQLTDSNYEDYFNLKLFINSIPVDKKEIENLLRLEEEIENFEKCSILLDLINRE